MDIKETYLLNKSVKGDSQWIDILMPALRTITEPCYPRHCGGPLKPSSCLGALAVTSIIMPIGEEWGLLPDAVISACLDIRPAHRFGPDTVTDVVPVIIILVI